MGASATDSDIELLAERFEEHRARLRSIAYRMLGSLADADDAVQETWLRLARTGADEIGNLGGWLTTAVSRICLDILRTRTSRREDSLDMPVPDPIVAVDPEQESLLADSVGLALLMVLDTLEPAERLAFVLHDVFAVPFDRIGATLGRSPAAARQLASRARRRLREAPEPESDLRRQRSLVDRFLAAARGGDLDALFEVLDPDVVLRADAGDGPLGPSRVVRGAAGVIAQAQHYTPLARFGRRVLVNDAPGLIVAPGDRVLAVMALTFGGGRITRIDILADPQRLERLAVARSIDGPTAPDPHLQGS